MGCSGNPAVIINASYLEKKGDEVVDVGSTAEMTSDSSGATITVGGTANKGISVRIVEIAAEKVVLEVTHPQFEAQRATLKRSESAEVFFDDGSEGVRLRFSNAK